MRIEILRIEASQRFGQRRNIITDEIRLHPGGFERLLQVIPRRNPRQHERSSTSGSLSRAHIRGRVIPYDPYLIRRQTDSFDHIFHDDRGRLADDHGLLAGCGLDRCAQGAGAGYEAPIRWQEQIRVRQDEVRAAADITCRALQLGIIETEIDPLHDIIRLLIGDLLQPGFLKRCMKPRLAENIDLRPRPLLANIAGCGLRGRVYLCGVR